jgi:transcriptional regulator with GAF, ATPase, and Fis domain
LSSREVLPTTPCSSPATTPRLAIVVRSPDTVATYPIPVSGDVTIGRSQDVDIAIDDGSVSRRHARIYGGDPARLEDLGSTNGTRVMGRALRPGERVVLGQGNVLQFGDIVAFVDVYDGEPQATAARPQTNPPRRPDVASPLTDIVLESPVMRRLYTQVTGIASSGVPVLVLGETGVGKDVYAQQLHKASPRRAGSFISLNCPALPEGVIEAELFGHERGAFTGAVIARPGLLEMAHEGTLFLDEIGDLSQSVQSKLLRFLENGEVWRVGGKRARQVDVRVIAATNCDLPSLVSSRRFRADLYYRLNGITVVIPPLRERSEDLMPLARHFVARAAQTNGRAAPELTDSAIRVLSSHAWPGNIRELRAVCERAVISSGEVIEDRHIQLDTEMAASAQFVAVPHPREATVVSPSEPTMVRSIRQEFAALERTRIEEALRRCGGNQSRAARELGIARATLVRRLDEYGLLRPRKRLET